MSACDSRQRKINDDSFLSAHEGRNMIALSVFGLPRSRNSGEAARPPSEVVEWLKQ